MMQTCGILPELRKARPADSRQEAYPLLLSSACRQEWWNSHQDLRCIVKRYMNSPVPAAADASPPTATHTGNTALMPATSKRDSKEALTE
jgi:hypothetical protein